MFKLTISKYDFRKFYFHSYYQLQPRVIRFMRWAMGPFLVLVSIYLYDLDVGIHPFAIGFLAAFGFIYVMRPIITSMAYKMQDEEIRFGIKEGKLQFKDRLNEAKIDLSKNKLQQNKKYYYIKLENKQTLFFPKEILDDKMKNHFESYLRGEFE